MSEINEKLITIQCPWICITLQSVISLILSCNDETINFIAYYYTYYLFFLFLLLLLIYSFLMNLWYDIHFNLIIIFMFWEFWILFGIVETNIVIITDFRIRNILITIRVTKIFVLSLDANNLNIYDTINILFFFFKLVFAE